MKPIEQLIGEAFSSELGQQCNSLFSTSDNRIFIRLQEAIAHSKGELGEGIPLEDTTIYEWYEEWHGGASLPEYVKIKCDSPEKGFTENRVLPKVL